jgi:hypothetical protein
VVTAGCSFDCVRSQFYHGAGRRAPA